jgi:hypothetical protein
MKLKAIVAMLVFSNICFGEVLLRDIGVIGLSSHDMFTWDKEREVNLENGRLDLSTIFDYENGSRWEKGGNPKNAENAPVWTITKGLVKYYKNELKKNDKTTARLNTVKHFHNMVKESFERLSSLEFPVEGLNADVTNTEQAVMRALHDILPGRVKTYRSRMFPIRDFNLTNFIFAKFNLNEKELNQPIKYYDGDYDSEYKAIKIPFTRKKINLKEIDGKFISNFSEYDQDNMLRELKRVGDGEIHMSQVYFIHHFKELYSKGICSTDNGWIEAPACN